MLARRNSWPALEILKAFAIIAMIFIHAWGCMVTPDDLIAYKNYLGFKLANVLHFFCFFNIWIPAIAGSSLRLQSDDTLAPDQLRKVLRAYSFKWGIVLAGFGFLFSLMINRNNLFLFYNPLHFIGGSFLVISLLLSFSSTSKMWGWALLFFVFSLFGETTRQYFIVNPPYRIYQMIQSGWVNSLKAYLLEIIFGSSNIGWSFLPWIVSVFLGFAFIDRILKSKKFKKDLNLIFLITLAIVIVSLSRTQSIQFIEGQTINDQYTALAMPLSLFVAVTAGYLMLFSIGILYYPSKYEGAVPQVITYLSRGSLWIFFLEFPLLSIFRPVFEPLSFNFRIFVFPMFILCWCIVIGTIAVWLGEKKIKISLVRKRQQ